MHARWAHYQMSYPTNLVYYLFFCLEAQSHSWFFSIFFLVQIALPSRHEMVLHSAVSPHVRGGRLLHFPSKLLSFSINKSISEVAGSHLISLQRTQRNSLPLSCAVWLPKNMESQLLLWWFICPFEPRCFPDPREISFPACWKYVLF